MCILLYITTLLHRHFLQIAFSHSFSPSSSFLFAFFSLISSGIKFCKIYNKNVGLRQNKNVGKPTFLFCILGHIDTLLLEVFQYENQFTRRVNHHGQFRG